METLQSPKQQAAQLLNRLPDDCSMEDIHYHLYVLEKVQHGLEDAESGSVYSTEEAKERLKKWL